MKSSRQTKLTLRSGLAPLLAVAAILTLHALPAFAQAFDSTELRTGISNSLAVIMMFGFVLGISAVMYGGFAIRRGDDRAADDAHLALIDIAAAPAAVYAFYQIFGIADNSSVGVGTF
jgi:hypothetical protein